MDRKIQKIKKYVNEYIGKSTGQIFQEWGQPTYNSDERNLIYTKKDNFLFEDEICFFMENEKV